MFVFSYIFTETVDNSNDSIMRILSEQKILIDRLLAQNKTVNNIMSIFPICSAEKLKEFDDLLPTVSDPYVSICFN